MARTGAGGNRTRRKHAVRDYKRGIILKAARRVFAARGFEGASLRAIARAAGYTPPALYFHFASKEDIYGELLALSLLRLDRAVRAAAAAAGPARRLAGGAFGFFDHYRSNPREFELGLLLFGGSKPLGMRSAQSAELKARLDAVLDELERGLRELGASPADAARNATALLAFMIGLLLLAQGPRGRSFGVNARVQLQQYLERMTAAAAAAQAGT